MAKSQRPVVMDKLSSSDVRLKHPMHTNLWIKDQ